MVTATKKTPTKATLAKPVPKVAVALKPAKAAAPVPAPAVAVAPPKAVKPAKPVKAPKPVKPAKPPKAPKPAKPKLERERVRMLKTDFEMLAGLKQRAARLKFPAKKSDVLRAGIKALARLSDTAFLAGLKALPALKTTKKT